MNVYLNLYISGFPGLGLGLEVRGLGIIPLPYNQVNPICVYMCIYIHIYRVTPGRSTQDGLTRGEAGDATRNCL